MRTAEKGHKSVKGTRTEKNTIRMSSPSQARPQARRVSFLVSDSVLKDLRDLAGPDETMTDVFRKAVASLKYLESRKREGKRFFVGNAPDVIESEVVLLR